MANLWDALKQYIEDASPGGALNPEVTPQGVLDAAAISTMPVPVLGDVLGAGADIYRMAKNPEERTLGNAGLAALGLIPFVPGITAWHGSPYKFGAFDPTQMGKGAGAQQYGAGHYFATDPNVSKGYVPRDPAFEEQLMRLYKQAERKQDYDSMQVLEDAMLHRTPNELRADYGKAAEGLISKIESIPQKGGLYKVDIADEAIPKMLNWDQELGQQTPEIMKLAKQYGLAMDDLGGDLVAAMNAKQAAGAEAMRQAGVPGVKYIDPQQRGGSMSSGPNYVVFPGNEGLLKMLEMNDKPMSFWGF